MPKKEEEKIILECLDERLERNGGGRKKNEALKIFLTEK